MKHAFNHTRIYPRTRTDEVHACRLHTCTENIEEAQSQAWPDTEGDKVHLIRQRVFDRWEGLFSISDV